MTGFLSIIILALLVFLFLKSRKASLPTDNFGIASEIGAIKTLLTTVENNQKFQQQTIEELKGFISSDSKGQEKIQANVEGTLRAVEGIRQHYEASKKVEESNLQSLRRLEAIIAGTKSKGTAGENVLKEAFSVLPPHMIESNFKIKGKEVEFGLLLANKKVMPIDSKWSSTELLDSLSREQDPQSSERIINQIEREVVKRVSEVSQYIDSNITTPWAIAAIPDSVYSVCKGAHMAAYSKNVILVSYSMLLPYVLMFFSLYLQYSSTMDMENLNSYLIDIKRNVEQMNEILANKMEKASSMLGNACNEYRQIIGSIKGCITSLESQSSRE
jgi:DNA recombination protein RmuC